MRRNFWSHRTFIRYNLLCVVQSISNITSDFSYLQSNGDQRNSCSTDNYIYLYANTVLDGSVILSVILFVRYRNHFPVVQFQNQAHIRNPHDTGQVYKTIQGAADAPERVPLAPQFLFYCRRPEWDAPGAPNMGHRRRPTFMKRK